MLRDALNTKPLAGLTKLQTSVLGKAIPTEAKGTLHHRSHSCSLDGEEGGKAKPCITDWNAPEMNHFV